MKKILVSFLLLFLLLFTSTTIVYAWNDLEVGQSETLTIGAWDFVPEWNSITNYVKNDKVIYNNIIYI